MEMLPKISIITPTLNQGEYIEQTINSILDQAYPNLEYVIIDGGSTDNTLEILKKYQGKLSWISEKDRGQSHAINKGLRRVSGEIIAFLNSDDLYETGALLKVGRFFQTNQEADWLTGRCRIIGQNGTEMRKLVTAYKQLWLKTRSNQVLLVLNYISQPACFWRKNVINTVGEFDETLHYAMDYDYNLRVSMRYKLWLLDDTLAAYRIHADSKAGSSAYDQFRYDFQIAKRYVNSPMLVWLHGFHNAITANVYRVWMSSSSFVMNLRASEAK